LSNFFAGSEVSGSVGQRIDSVVTKIRSLLVEACQSSPDRSFVISPPMYRTTPTWYRDGLPEILATFSQVLLDESPKNLHLLSSFATPEFETDGIHLTSFSGLEFITNLFESADELLDNLQKTPVERCNIGTESTRILQDRMVVLEQDHRRLNRFVENKAAIDAELADYRENERLEDSFVITGLKGGFSLMPSLRFSFHSLCAALAHALILELHTFHSLFQHFPPPCPERIGRPRQSAPSLRSFAN
jgi:hypothetical protein